jgi:toluene monooxygenase electron transfer component
MSYTIQIDGGAAFSMRADEDSLLRGALRAGVGLPHECSVGGCGACRFEIVAGAMADLWPAAPGLSERDRKRGKHLACQSLPQGDCTIKVRCDDAYKPVRAPLRGSARVLQHRLLSADMLELTLMRDAGADFLPGQYALLYPPGTPGARAYSMANLGNAEGRWQFIVRRVPNGCGSNALFDRVAVGDTLTLDGPYGHAYLRGGEEREVVCIGGGSGLAPMLSVARGALREGRRVHFFYGARGSADLAATADLDALEREHPALLSRTTVLSLPDASWSGATGFVHEHLEAVLGADLPRHAFYFAGPPPMIEALQTLLMHQRQVPFEQIHFDRFV